MAASGTGGTTKRLDTGARGSADDPIRVCALEGITGAEARPDAPVSEACPHAAADECGAIEAGADVGAKCGARACNLRSA